MGAPPSTHEEENGVQRPMLQLNCGRTTILGFKRSRIADLSEFRDQKLSIYRIFNIKNLEFIGI